MEKIDQLKKLLQSLILDEDCEGRPTGDFIEFSPILDDPDKIVLQVSGLAIDLYPDGTYKVESTKGG